MVKPECKWFWDGLDTYLLANQLKQTKQRKMIVSEFLEMPPHVQAEELYHRINKKGQKIGLATIYRTLNLLKEAKLVEQCIFADGRSVFELSPPGSHHDHLICLSCGEIAEFENEEIEAVQRQVAQDRGFELYSHRLYLYGLCTSCQRKKQ